MTNTDKKEASNLYRSLEEALSEWRGSPREPEYCGCGEQILTAEPEAKLIYCDRQNQWIHKSDPIQMRPFWYGHCPVYAKKQIEKSVQAVIPTNKKRPLTTLFDLDKSV